MAGPFSSPEEFRQVLDRVFTTMNEDPETGSRMREADVSQRLEFIDIGLVINIRAGRPGELHDLHWEWAAEVDWSPKVRMAMSTATANRYLQGRENVALAILRGRIRTDGDLKAALQMIPITKPFYERFRAVIASEYPHLAV